MKLILLPYCPRVLPSYVVAVASYELKSDLRMLSFTVLYLRATTMNGLECCSCVLTKIRT